MELEVLRDPTPSRLPLNTLDDVRLEMAKVYRSMKGGSLPSQDGTRLVYVLAEIKKTILMNEIDVRIRKLEEAQDTHRLAR